MCRIYLIFCFCSYVARCGLFFFFFKQKTAYEMLRSLVGSEMCIRDRDGGRKDSGMDKAHKYKKLYSIKAKELEQERENAKQQTEKAEKLLTANSQLRSELEKAKTQLVEQDKELLDKSMQLSATKGKLLTIERDSSAQRLTSAEGEMKKKMMVELADLKLENQRLSNQLNDQHKKFMDLEAKNTELELKLKHGDPPTN
eukprot:TRINITY_DN5584_c0_g1_i4.p1 TRINITY_DN5584_c0_g1~~TRINITY_DN5584_c0_g1_i4.p1  ORF type:complete len:199 (+),score=76.97 TRINITY_DN5584_c0_g1_i4:24-620(+)